MLLYAVVFNETGIMQNFSKMSIMELKDTQDTTSSDILFYSEKGGT